MVIKSKLCSFKELDEYVMGLQFTYEALYGNALSHLNNKQYRLELYKDEETGIPLFRIMKGNRLLVPPEDLTKKVAKLLEDI
jgi:hypothetical protein